MIKKFLALSLSCLVPIGSQLLANTEPAAQKIKVACVGDSITYGAYIADRENANYPAQLQKLLGDDFEVRNFGQSGRTLLNAGDHPYTKSSNFEEALNFAPDVVVIKLGTNDSKSHNWRHKNNFISDYQGLINRFRQLPSQPVVWICKPVPAFLEGVSINGSIVAHEILPRIDSISQKTGAPVIDLHTPLLAFPQHFPDKVHPNADGAGEIAKIVAGVLSKYRDQAPPTVGQDLVLNSQGTGDHDTRQLTLPQFNSGTRLLFIGDSITDMSRDRRPNTTDKNHLLGHSYVFLLAARLGVDTPGLEFINRGISGNTVQDLSARWQADAIAVAPDVLTVLIGVNDSIKELPVENYETTYRNLLHDSRKANPDLKIILMDSFILPVGGKSAENKFQEHRERVDGYRKAVARLAKEFGAIHLRTQELFDRAAAPPSSPAYWLWDGIHPLPQGHELIAREWLRRVAKDRPE